MSLNKIFGTISILVLSTAIWLTLFDQPIANKINTWQANMMGRNEYFPALTIFLLALPPLLVLILVKMYLLKREKKH